MVSLYFYAVKRRDTPSYVAKRRLTACHGASVYITPAAEHVSAREKA